MAPRRLLQETQRVSEESHDERAESLRVIVRDEDSDGDG